LASFAGAAWTFLSALLSDGTVAVNPAALEEAVAHHAVAEHKKEDREEEYEQEMAGSERGWHLSGRVCGIRVRRIR